MGGDIKIVKKEGPGTLLRFYLLFGQPVDNESETPRLSVPAELENTKVRILVLTRRTYLALPFLDSRLDYMFFWIASRLQFPIARISLDQYGNNQCVFCVAGTTCNERRRGKR